MNQGGAARRSAPFQGRRFIPTGVFAFSNINIHLILSLKQKRHKPRLDFSPASLRSRGNRTLLHPFPGATIHFAVNFAG